MKDNMKRVSSYILILSFLNFVGCYSSRAVDKEILISKNIEEAVRELTIIINDDNKIIIDEITHQILDDNLYEDPVGELNIITNDDNKIIIDEITYQIVNDTLYAEGINKTNTEVYGKPIDVKIALADIQQVEIDEFNEVGTIVSIISLTGIAVLVIVATVQLSSFKWPKSCKAHGFNFQPD